MTIHKPTRLVFTLATILAETAFISSQVAKQPIVDGNEFLTLEIALILLQLGVVLRGLWILKKM